MSRFEKRNEKKKHIKAKIVGCFGAVALIYLLGAYYFHTHYFPNTKIGSIKIGMQSEKKAKENLKKELAKFTLKVEEKDGNESISAADAGLSYEDLDSIGDLLKKQNHALWLFQLGKKNRYQSLTLKVDQNKLATAIDQLKVMHPAHPVQSTDAKIKYDKKKKVYKIKKEQIGNIVDPAAFLDGATKAFITVTSTISLKDTTYFQKPAYTADSEAVVTALNTLNGYLNTSINYKDGSLKMKVKKDDIRKLVTVSDDFKVSIDKKKLRKYVGTTVAGTYNNLTSSDGSQVDVPSGMSSWTIDVKKEADALEQDLTENKSETRKPIYATKGLNRSYGIRHTYLDVNIGDQVVRFAKNGKVVFTSDVVTGNISTGHGTQPGVYRIAFKQRDHLMKKYNSFVHYWMPFDTGVGVGFHDAPWRGSFGGNIYRTNGSHGCVNMPPAKAAELYSILDTGTPVYVH
ncbi:MAG: L,D-transpeptidase family protein [Lachnospiraceae bacterium]|nr:L,D-transpeptidase family protein [Lachnospiraceae bacterium]